MGQTVFGQSRLLGKGLLADCAFKWFLPRMHTRMISQIGFLPEFLVTNSTFKFLQSIVDLHVILQSGRRLEIHFADIAGKWAFPSVTSHVVGQHTLISECACA